MTRKAASFTVSLLLHGLALSLLFLSWKPQAIVELGSSVPVELISSVPQQQMAAAPVDEHAVKPPAPAPDIKPEPVHPAPQPKLEPAPKAMPKPERDQPEPRPEKVAPKAADRNGLKKPEPLPKPQKPVSGLDLDALSEPSAVQSRTHARSLPQASPRPTSGLSQQGTAPQDMGPVLSALKAAVQRNWNPCHVAGANRIDVTLSFTLSRSGLISRGPEWVDRRADPDAAQAAAVAMAAVKAGEPYAGLPDAAYNRPITLPFSPRSFCRNL